MKTILALSIAVLSLIAGIVHADKYTESDVRQAIEGAAKQLPIQMDTYTQVTAMYMAGPKNLIYRYAFDIEKFTEEVARQASVTPEKIYELRGGRERWANLIAEQEVAPFLLRQTCSVPFQRDLLTDGYRFEYQTFDNQGTFLFKSTVDRLGCGF